MILPKPHLVSVIALIESIQHATRQCKQVEMHWRHHSAACVCAIKVCRESDSMADAAKKLFAVSFKTKKSSNNSERLSKYLAKFGLKFKGLHLRK